MTMMGQGVSVPPWGNLPASGVGVSGDNMPYLFAAGAEEEDEAAVDAYSCDRFRMYDFKVRWCARRGSHDWTDCPFAHPGEKARRRDPRKHHYSGTACPDFRKAGCSRGDACEYAHGVFECWLHPARYRTQPCKDGTACRRRVCFFAHTASQHRAMPSKQSSPKSKPLSPLDVSYDGSPLRRQAFESYLSNSIMPSSPTGTLLSSPPMSPLFPEGPASVRPDYWPGIGSPVDEVIASLRQLHLAKADPGKWSANPVSPTAYGSPTTPLCAPTTASSFMANMKPLNICFIDDDEPVQMVQSGRALREKVSERLSRDGAASARCETGAGARGPDVAWVFDLIN